MNEENGPGGGSAGEDVGFRRLLRRTVARIAQSHTLGGFIRATNQLPLHPDDVGVRPPKDESVRELAERQRRKRQRRLFVFYAVLGVLSIASVIVAIYFLYRLAAGM